MASTGDEPSVRLRVRLTPRASREQVTLKPDGTLVVRVSAPPVDGRANAALERAVADALRVAPSRVTLVRGVRSRDKLVQVDGLDAGGVRERLAG
ncbi:MAG TPA: DUF167 domain-containing protein [Solirubrobacteraceae bacterium]|nr:DUF167 domain-containing protein [Solirubrobacteraceae bacterium]